MVIDYVESRFRVSKKFSSAKGGICPAIGQPALRLLRSSIASLALCRRPMAFSLA